MKVSSCDVCFGCAGEGLCTRTRPVAACGHPRQHELRLPVSQQRCMVQSRGQTHSQQTFPIPTGQCKKHFDASHDHEFPFQGFQF